MSVTTQDLGDSRTSIKADGADLVIERMFDAPRHLVWAAMTTAEFIPQWWGPHGTTAAVETMDVRPGGKWRWIADHRSASGGAPFAGEYIEVVAPERMVRTLVLDVPPFNTGPSAVETITLEEVDGGTRLHYHTKFPAAEVLEGAIADGMTKGGIEQYERLDALLATLR